MTRAPRCREFVCATVLAGTAALALLGGCARKEPPKGLEGVVVNGSDSLLRDITFFGQTGPVAPAIATCAPHDSARLPLPLAAEDAVFATFLAGGGLHVSADSAVATPGATSAVRVLVDSRLEAHCIAH